MLTFLMQLIHCIYDISNISRSGSGRSVLPTINFASLNRTVHFNGSPINTKERLRLSIEFYTFSSASHQK